MRIGRIFAGFLAVLAIAGCTDRADMVPLNQQAQAAGGNPRLYFTRGLPFGVSEFVMPSGEILPGKFEIDQNYTPTPGGGNFHVYGNGARTRLVCVGNMSEGHGTAECHSQDGALYRMTL